MKSETQIAQESISSMKHYKGDDELYTRNVIKCGTHKESCERFLEFLEDVDFDESPFEDEGEGKITELKQAIKLYTENGI